MSAEQDRLQFNETNFSLIGGWSASSYRSRVLETLTFLQDILRRAETLDRTDPELLGRLQDGLAFIKSARGEILRMMRDTERPHHLARREGLLEFTRLRLSELPDELYPAVSDSLMTFFQIDAEDQRRRIRVFNAFELALLARFVIE